MKLSSSLCSPPPYCIFGLIAIHCIQFNRDGNIIETLKLKVVYVLEIKAPHGDFVSSLFLHVHFQFFYAVYVGFYCMFTIMPLQFISN